MTRKQWILLVVAVVVWVIVLAIVLANPDKADAQSCYAIMYTQVMSGDTWQSVASHWGMTTATLKAMNKKVPRKGGQPKPGSMLKVAVWIGCPR